MKNIIRCKVCGFNNSNKGLFCENCGNKLDEENIVYAEKKGTSRYILGAIFCFAGLMSLFNSGSVLFNIFLILFGISLFPFIYDIFLDDFKINNKKVYNLHIIIPIIVVLLYALISSLVKTIEHKNNDIIEPSVPIQEEIEYKEFTWPDSEIGNLLPVPKSNIGKIYWEASYGFVIYVSETTKEDYDSYVNSCRERGFILDYRKGEDYYYASNAEGYKLSLKFQGDNIMFIRIDEPEDNGVDESLIDTNPSTNNTSGETTSTSTNNGIRPEFKAALDEYEAFMDEYIAFIRKYKNSNYSSSMLNDYAQMMKRYSEFVDKIDKLEDAQMSTEESLYYLEVTLRVTKKLSEVN